jgi:hypothetical protein
MDAFPLDPHTPDGYGYHCKACKAAAAKARRKNIPAEDKAEAQRAYRAGMRKDRCALCSGPIEGHGICDRCADAVEVLGGLDGLKQAVRTMKYLGE